MEEKPQVTPPLCNKCASEPCMPSHPHCLTCHRKLSKVPAITISFKKYPKLLAQILQEADEHCNTPGNYLLHLLRKAYGT
jgi:hypothetical protein